MGGTVQTEQQHEKLLERCRVKVKELREEKQVYLQGGLLE
jgi:hypothetical protein